MAALDRIKWFCLIKLTLPSIKVSPCPSSLLLLFNYYYSSLLFFTVLQNRCSQKFPKFHRKTPVLESLFNKVASLKETSTQVFSCELCKISKNTFFTEHLQWLLLNRPREYLWFIVWQRGFLVIQHKSTLIVKHHVKLVIKKLFFFLHCCSS